MRERKMTTIEKSAGSAGSICTKGKIYVETSRGLKEMKVSVRSDLSMNMREFLGEFILQQAKKVGYYKIEGKSACDMALSIDYLGRESGLDKFAVAHNFIQNGDVMADPDMEFYDYQGVFIASSYQLDSLGVFQQAIEQNDEGVLVADQQLQEELQRFSEQWAQTLYNKYKCS